MGRNRHPAFSPKPPAGMVKPVGAESIRIMLFLLLSYTAWVWAGLRPSFHWAAVGLAGWLLVRLVRDPAGGFGWRDPVFFLGLSFLGYLGIQWANAGRSQYFDVGYQRWMYTPPPWPGWPSAYTRADARQMVTWFFPAWVIALAFRSGRLDRHAVRGLLLWLAGNAGLLALFGLVQYALTAKAIYWLQPLNGHFFASFAYGNHAAPYFVLMGALAAGMLFREVFDAHHARADSPSVARLRHPVRVGILVPVLLLCLVGANLGLSRAGVILAWTLSGLLMVYGCFRAWRVLSIAGRVNFAALLLGSAALLYFAVAGFGKEAIRREFTPKPDLPEEVQHSLWNRINQQLEGRPLFARAALAVWAEHPWLGVGGWGYKYRVADHVPQEFWPALERRGWANVHFDFLQFLTEFGIFGFGLMLGALGVMVGDLFSRACRRDALWVMGGAGLGLVLVFSLVDLPFRCPAILYAWVALLAALPRACSVHRTKRGLLASEDDGRETILERTGP